MFSCCAPVHTTLGEVFYPRAGGADERLGPSALPAAPPEPTGAIGGLDRADWTPRAAAASGFVGDASSRTALSPPQELFVDPQPLTRCSTAAASAQDSASKANERSRLRKLVSDFVQEASRGRPCSVVALNDASGGSVGSRQDAHYEISEEVQVLIIRRKADAGDGGGQPIGSWPLRAVLGAHKAGDSALVQSARHDIDAMVSHEELSRSAVLEFGSGARTPLLLVEESTEYRDRFVSGMQILRLYRGAAQRLESAKTSGERRMNSAEASPPSVGSSSVANENARKGPTTGTRFCAPARMGAVADDAPPDDGWRPGPVSETPSKRQNGILGSSPFGGRLSARKG